MLRTLAVSGYRSVRELIVPLGRLTVITGKNGSGKTNLYRAIRHLSSAARGDLARSLAEEGGIESALWAGPESPTGAANPVGTIRKGPISLRLGFASDELGYLVDLGLPEVGPGGTLFARDAQIKQEHVFAGDFCTPARSFVVRKGGGARVRDTSWRGVEQMFASWESVLTELVDRDATPELLALRRELGSWRFFDQLRTDAAAPARGSTPATRSLRLSGDGDNLASAWASTAEAGYAHLLVEQVDRAFPGSRVFIEPDGTELRLRMKQPGLLRPLDASELSDGTLRYLLLTAALIPARPGSFTVLNEPEASLHPDVIAPLSGLIRTASEDTQLVVVTHSRRLASSLEADGASMIELTSGASGTGIEGQGPVDAPPWRWPKR